eukprot:gene7272-6685_t
MGLPALVEKLSGGQPAPSLYLQPQGASYLPDFISSTEETMLLEEINAGSWAREEGTGRPTQQYGYHYNFNARQLDRTAPPFPARLDWLADRLHQQGIVSRKPNQGIVNQYEAEEGISPHRDHHSFEDEIAVLSLLSPRTMAFINQDDRVAQQFGVPLRHGTLQYLAPRSLLLMRESSRWLWAHAFIRELERASRFGRRSYLWRCSHDKKYKAQHAIPPLLQVPSIREGGSQPRLTDKLCVWTVDIRSSKLAELLDAPTLHAMTTPMAPRLDRILVVDAAQGIFSVVTAGRSFWREREAGGGEKGGGRSPQLPQQVSLDRAGEVVMQWPVDAMGGVSVLPRVAEPPAPAGPPNIHAPPPLPPAEREMALGLTIGSSGWQSRLPGLSAGGRRQKKLYFFVSEQRAVWLVPRLLGSASPLTDPAHAGNPGHMGAGIMTSPAVPNDDVSLALRQPGETYPEAGSSGSKGRKKATGG